MVVHHRPVWGHAENSHRTPGTRIKRYVRPMSRSALLTVLLAFALSVVVRWPLVDRPLSAHHEYCTAFTLIALTNWWEDGYTTHHGMPSGGFIREAARLYPADRYDRNARAVGTYYFSHPPLAFDLPYLLFVITDTAPNAAGLQWMNIFFHLVAALALFHAVRIGWGERLPRAPLYASVLYLLLPATLWFHGNAYMSDMFVQVPWALHLAFAMRVMRPDTRPSRWVWVGYGTTLFLMAYTSWLGVFAAVAGSVVGCWRWWHDRRTPIGVWLGWCAVAVVLAVGLTAWRYLQVIDAEALLAQLRSRYSVRGAFGLEHGLRPVLKQMALNYRIGFLPLILLLALLLVYEVVRSGRRRSVPEGFWPFVLVSGLPVVLDHALLLQYAMHDFAMLKAAPLLCGLAGWSLCLHTAYRRHLALAATCVASILYFYRINPLTGHDGGRYGQERALGTFIADHAAADEVVFGQGVSTEPQVVWYARRNVIGIADEAAARAFLRDRGLTRGVLISATGSGYTAKHLER